MLAGGSAFAALFSLGSWAKKGLSAGRRLFQRLGFQPVRASSADQVVVPEGYQARPFFAWGTPVRPTQAGWKPASSAEEQRYQAGMHHDGMAFFPVDARWDVEQWQLDGSSTHGFLALNHEYTDEGLLHEDGVANWSAEKVLRSKAAVGVSVIEIEQQDGEWQILDGRRITGLDSYEVGGPARGHALLKSPASDSPGDREGTTIEGTFGNCANGQTPWGTYLTCEENVQDYFARDLPSLEAVGKMNEAELLVEARLRRYGIGAAFKPLVGWRSAYGWDQFDDRFNSDLPQWSNYSNRYGWVVEIDPRDPERKPVKRTALGRFRHENASVVVGPDGRVVTYMGDDARFEYVYKFVSDGKFDPELPEDDDAERSRKRDHNWGLLDEGTLYVARFDEGDTGLWLPLTLDNPQIKASGMFRDDAEIVVYARHAADLVGATKMDRPEWLTVDQDKKTREVDHVYVSLTNNTGRGMPGAPGPNPANPRVDNIYGHIVRWRETSGDPTATTFQWSIFVMGGYHGSAVEAQRGTIKPAPGSASMDFGSPDGLTMDPRGSVLWVQTDVSVSLQNQGAYKTLGNNQMLAIDVATGEVRRFLTGPRGCEITGLAFTPDCRTMFVNVQHPGETSGSFSDPANPMVVSSWPNGAKDGKPRSATVIVTRDDGGPIGA